MASFDKRLIRKPGIRVLIVGSYAAGWTDGLNGRSPRYPHDAEYVKGHCDGMGLRCRSGNAGDDTVVLTSAK